MRFLAFIFQVLSIALSLAQPLLIGRLLDAINNAVATSDYQPIQQLTLILIIVSISDFVVYYFKDFLFAKALYNGANMMREFVLSLGLDQPTSRLDKNNVGDKLNKILNDSEVYARYIVYQIPNTIIIFIRIISIYIILLSMSIELTGIIAIIFIVYLMMYLRINKKIRPYISKEYEDYSNVMNQASETMDGYETIKINVQEEYFKNRFSSGLNRYLKSKIQVEKFNSLDNALLNFFYSIIPVLILGAGAYFVLNGKITPGVLLAFHSYTHWIIEPVYGLANLNRIRQQAVAALPRLNSFVEPYESKSSEELKTTIKHINSIKLDGITFSYDDSKTIINDLNLNLCEGSKIAITGESGSGKSTFAKILLGLLHPAAGTVLVNDIPLKTINLQSYLMQCSYTPQEIFLFSESLQENITFSRDADRISYEILKELNLLELVNRDIKNIKELSGGEKQRVGIARSMYRYPSLLIYDEPTSALDENMEKAIINAIDKYASQNPCVLVVITHRKPILDICDTELHISDHGNFQIKSL